MNVKSAISNAGSSRFAPVCVMLLALVVSLLFCFVAFPRLADSVHLVLDPDRHGPLAEGLIHNHSLSWYPDTVPTITRGPIYPAFVALTLLASGGWWPYATQICQCIVFALTCGLVFWSASKLWSRPVGLIAGTVCAVHPIVYWYTSRIWVETISIFLVTATIAAMIYLMDRPSPWRAVLLGAVIGIACLNKGAFLPFVVVVPVILCCLKPKRLPCAHGFSVFLIASLVIAPWTARNYLLTGHVVPVAAMAGWNAQVGDYWMRDLPKCGLSMAKLWDMSVGEIRNKESNAPPGLTGPRKEQWMDKYYTSQSAEHYRKDPGFFIKKIATNAIFFWSLAETPKKTLLMGLQQFALLLLCALSALKLRRYGFPTLHSAIGLLIIIIYVLHLPLLSEARYSVVLVPAMIIYAAGLLDTQWKKT